MLFILKLINFSISNLQLVERLDGKFAGLNFLRFGQKTNSNHILVLLPKIGFDLSIGFLRSDQISDQSWFCALPWNFALFLFLWFLNGAFYRVYRSNIFLKITFRYSPSNGAIIWSDGHIVSESLVGFPIKRDQWNSQIGFILAPFFHFIVQNAASIWPISHCCELCVHSSQIQSKTIFF